jgi:uncharacterized zinc-type alcohol dehydrogenase-like protein
MAANMLEFAKIHDVKPVIEEFEFSNMNDAMKRLESGDSQYQRGSFDIPTLI